MGFTYAYKLSGSAPTLVDFPVKADAVISAGEMVNLESGYLDGAAAGDTGLVGVALEAGDNTGGSSGDINVRAIIDPDAVYWVNDANARLAGATLDLATGAQGVAASSSTDLIVVAPSAATERTLVKIIAGSHYLTAAV